MSDTIRMSADDLTDFERQQLQAEGKIGPEGFVDIELPSTASDAQASSPSASNAQRHAVAAQLESVTRNMSTTASAAPPQPSEDDPRAYMAYLESEVHKLKTAYEDARKKLASRDPCPRCGLKLDEQVRVTPTAHDIDEFLQSVLASEPFSKEYLLFGGKLLVKFRTRTHEQDEAVRALMVRIVKSKQISVDAEIIATLKNISLAVSLVEYRTPKYALDLPELPLYPLEAFEAQVEQRLKHIPMNIRNVLFDVMGQFNELVTMLTARATDENFWQRTPEQPS